MALKTTNKFRLTLSVITWFSFHRSCSYSHTRYANTSFEKFVYRIDITRTVVIGELTKTKNNNYYLFMLNNDLKKKEISIFK